MTKVVKINIKQSLGDFPVNRPRNKHCTGFTLLEILIALLIFSMTVIGLFYSFKTFVISSETIKEQIIHQEKLTDAIKRINIDMESIFILQPPRYKPPELNSDPDMHRFIGFEPNSGQSIIQLMAFSSFAHAKFGADQWNGICKITYYLKLNEKKLYDLYRSDTIPPFLNEIGYCSDPVMIHDILKINIIYKNGEGTEYNYWDSDTEEFDYMFPSSIDLLITYLSGETKQFFSISNGLTTERKRID